jgi:hypothetical protein
LLIRLPQNLIDLCHEIPPTATSLIFPPENVTESLPITRLGRVELHPPVTVLRFCIKLKTAAMMICPPKLNILTVLLPPFMPRHASLFAKAFKIPTFNSFFGTL